MNKASVSVVIPSYNSFETLDRAINSIAKQTLLPTEVIIIDDCSTDKRIASLMLNIEEKYKSYFQIRIEISKVNQGPGISRNIGWNLSDQKFIAFLDADDAWHERKIEIQYGFMMENSSVDLSCHSNQIILDHKENSDKDLLLGNLNIESITFKSLLFKNKIGTRSVMVKRTVSNRFTPGKYHSEDYLLWLEIASAGYKITFMNLPLSFSFSHPFLGMGLSGNRRKMFEGRISNYNHFYKIGKIGKLTQITLVGFETLKYLRRNILAYTSKK